MSSLVQTLLRLGFEIPKKFTLESFTESLNWCFDDKECKELLEKIAQMYHFPHFIG
jgi:hypothetical protein